MEDEKNLPPHSNSSDDVENKIDDVLPVPSESQTSGRDDVDGPMDTSFRTAGEESHAADDATTREELGVDTTADGVDDFIDSAPQSAGDDQVDSDHPSDEVLEIAGEPVTWEPVEAQPEVSDAQDPDSDVDPINHDSDFFRSSYQSQKGAAHSDPGLDSDPSVEQELTHQCTACGTEIGTVPYCPQCGTEQYPQSRLSTLLSPLLSWSRPWVIRSVLTAGTLLALLALLANSGATALIISAITIPVVLLVRLAMQLQTHTTTGWIQIGIMAFIGLAAGLPLAWFAARTVRRSWIEGGVLNFGAAGFGGNFAEVSGTAPFVIWLVVGLLLPTILILGIGAIPAALRMVLNSTPRESTGMLLSGAVAAGYVVASGIMFYRPLYTELAPRMTTSQWTLTIFGLAIIRPLVWIFSGAMVGAVIWRYVRTASPASIMIPATIAVGIPLVFTLVSLAVAPTGYWAETILGLIFASVAVFFFYRFLPVALKNDAQLSQEQAGEEE